MTVGRFSGNSFKSGYSIYEGLGALTSSGFVLNRSNFAVLSAQQRESGFVLEVAGLDEFPGGFTVDLHAERGSRIARLSSCNSIQSTGTLGHRFVWPDVELDWKPGETATITIHRAGSWGPTETRERPAQGATRLASFEDAPAHHDGRAFEVTLRLLERYYETAVQSGAPTLRATAGVVSDLQRLPGSGDRWRLTVAPDGRQAVGLRLVADPGCNSVDGACERVPITDSEPTEIIVPGPPVTARMLDAPDYHSGLALVPIQIAFSDSISTSLRDLTRRVLYTNGTPLAGVRRVDDRADLLEVIMAPDSSDDVEIAIDPAQVCAHVSGRCRDDLQRLSEPVELIVPAATIHLTFDDGPHPVYTPQILDILSYYGARATFFVTGVGAEAYPELIQRIVNEGHTLANHTWNHDTLAGLSRAEFDRTITRTQVTLGEHATPCLRPPNYSTDEHTAQHAARLGLRLIMGTVRTSDWMLPGADVIAGRIFAGAAPNAVIVLHDGGGDRSQTVDGLRDAMWNLRTLNYAFEPVCLLHRPASPRFAPSAAWPMSSAVPMPPLDF